MRRSRSSALAILGGFCLFYLVIRPLTTSSKTCKPFPVALAPSLARAMAPYAFSDAPIVLRPTGDPVPVRKLSYPADRTKVHGAVVHETLAPLLPLVGAKAPEGISVPHYNHHPIVPRGAPHPSRLLFGYVTTTSRAQRMAPIWSRWLAPYPASNPSSEARNPLCLVIVAQTETEADIRRTRDVLRGEGLQHCSVRRAHNLNGAEDRYETRVLGMARELGHYAKERDREVDWFIWNDDDTLYLDLRTIRRMLARYNHQEDWFIGTSSESIEQEEYFYRMAFGGAGIFVSASMYAKIDRVLDHCQQSFTKDVFGGDEMLTTCAAHAIGVRKEEVLTIEPGLHQFDMKGDSSGFIQAGLPMLSMHHLLGGGRKYFWALLFPKAWHIAPISQVYMFSAMSRFFGGDNLFSRYLFENGKVSLVLGYSITIWEVAPTLEEFGRVEHTWLHTHLIYFPDRPLVPEAQVPSTSLFKKPPPLGKGTKRTYFISRFEQLDRTVALMEYSTVGSCGGGDANEKVKGADKTRIRLIWDMCDLEATKCRSAGELMALRRDAFTLEKAAKKAAAMGKLEDNPRFEGGEADPF